MITALEKSLQDLIANHPLLKGRLKDDVKTFPSLTVSELARSVPLNPPAVYTSWAGNAYKDERSKRTFALFLVAKNARNFQAVLEGDGATLGLYELVDAVEAIVEGSGDWELLGATPDNGRILGHGFLSATFKVRVITDINYENDIDSLNDFSTYEQSMQVGSDDAEHVLLDTITLPIGEPIE